jgi:NADH-quinone oxidoreductase subunit J
MLLGVDESEDLSVEPIAKQRPLAIILGGGLVAIIVAAVVTGRENFASAGGALENSTLESPDANIRALARSIFSDNVFAFEITSVLLLVAVVGTVVMARRMKSLGTGK